MRPSMGAKQTILNTLYAWERRVKTLKDLYAEIAPDVVLGNHHAPDYRADKERLSEILYENGGRHRQNVGAANP